MAVNRLHKLMIDSSSGLDWNPLRDTVQQTITAKLIVGDTDDDRYE